MITANSTTVTASHRISPKGFGPIALTVGEGSMAMIHPSRGLTPAANASGRNWLPGRRCQQSWQNPVTFDLTRAVEEGGWGRPISDAGLPILRLVVSLL